MTGLRLCGKTGARGGVAVVFRNGANVEQRLNRAAGAIACFSLLALAGCGGGGGGGNAFAASPAPTTPAVPTVPDVSVGPSNIDAVPIGAQLATASTPTLKTIALGTQFPLIEAVVSGNGTGNAVTSFNGGAAQLVDMGSKTSTGEIDTKDAGLAVFLLNVPRVGLPSDARLPSDGTVTVLSDGSSAWLQMHVLNYASLGFWNYAPTTGGFYFGTISTGYQTPSVAVPTAGIGTYVSDGGPNGHVFGNVWVPDGKGGVIVGSLNGQASVSVNFATGAVGGSLINMAATSPPAAGSAVTPWNNVTLSGSLSGASISGNTQASAAPSGAAAYGLSIGATGKFNGALYGPNGQELGAVWTLNDGSSTNGKTAIGALTATKQ